MKKILINSFLIFALLSINVACKNKKTTTIDNKKVLLVGIKRGACYGTCPVYEMKIMSDGRVSYKGIVHVSKKGDYEGMLSKTELQELTELVTDKELNICALKDEYAANGNVDFPSVFISTGYGCNKTINDHGNDEPVALTKLEEYLDKLSNNLKLTVVKVQSE